MTVSPRLRALLSLLAIICLLSGGWVRGASEPSPAEPPAADQPAAPSTPQSVGPQGGEQQEQTDQDYQTLRQRYRQDPTGVRARLGMCRGGHGGPYRHRHGAERWAQP